MALDPLAQQRLAIEAPLGPVLVVAGPGAGKTFCLIARINHLIGLEKLKKRSQSKLNIINTVFSKYNIPPELKYMAIVESNLNTDTVCNTTGATGIWQLMPVTACELGLKITDEVDERLHVYKSSAAAAKYLKQLYGEFGDWLLVVAAYNSGPAKVTRAINLSGYRNFWHLQNFLPEETRNHVKRFVSMLYFFEEQNSK